MADKNAPIYPVLVIGDSFTGKSSFFKTLIDGTCPTEPPKLTYGCDIHVVEFEGVWFDFYELGGSNLESQANHKVLAQDYAGYMFFFDLNNTNSLTYLVKIIEIINKIEDSSISDT